MIESVVNADVVKTSRSFENASSIDAKNEVDKIEKCKDEDFEFPPDDDILDMVKDVNLEKPLPLVTERYFTPYYRINFPKAGEDVCIRMHTNRLCMLSLAPSHAIFQGNRKIEKIDFQVTDKLNRANNSVSGKAKHGAQPLHESSKICSITCSDGSTWVIRCGMNGKLTEVNTDLMENPELVREPPHKGGYLAFVLPKLNAPEKMKQYLITQEVYDAEIRARTSINLETGVNTGNGAAAKRACEDPSTPEQCKEKVMKMEATEIDHKTLDETT